MNNNETTLQEPNLLNSFMDNVRSYLKSENKKYPVIFTFNQKVLMQKISKAPFGSVLVSCWFENHSGKDEIYFKNDTIHNTKISLRDLPFDRCIQIEVHEDYIEEMPNLNVFPTFENFAFGLSKTLYKEKRKIEIEFPYPVYIHELSLEPKTNFTIFGQISPLSDDNGKTWNNKICLFADDKTKIFYEANIIPYQSCLKVTLLEY
jgi:hypothetical protein